LGNTKVWDIWVLGQLGQLLKPIQERIFEIGAGSSIETDKDSVESVNSLEGLVPVSRPFITPKTFEWATGVGVGTIKVRGVEALGVRLVLVMEAR